MKRVRTLIIPYVSFPFIILIKPILKIALSFVQGSTIEIQTLLDTLFDVFIMGNGFWFLPCLLLSEILLYLIVKITKNNKNKIGIVLILLSIVGLLYTRIININLPLQLNSAILGTFFVGLGYISKEMIEDKKTKYKNILLCLGFLLINVISNIITFKLFSRTCSFGYMPNYILYLISTISGNLAIIFLSKYIDSNKFLEFYGRNSLIVYIFNDIILKIYKTIILVFCKINTGILMTIYQYLIASVVVILTVFTIIPIVIIVNKYFYFMLGKREKKISTLEIKF